MWTRKAMRRALPTPYTTRFPGTDNDVIASPSSAMAKASYGGEARLTTGPDKPSSVHYVQTNSLECKQLVLQLTSILNSCDLGA